MKRTTRMVAGLAVIMLGAMACGTARTDETSDVSSSDAIALVIQLLKDQAEGGMIYVPWGSLSEMLPGVNYLRNGKSIHATDAVVVGTLKSVSPGVAFVNEGGMDAEVPWDSDGVAGRSAYVSLSVQEVLCGQIESQGETTFSIQIDSPEQLPVLAKGLDELGTLAVFLTHYDGMPTDVYYLPTPGALVATIQADDTLDFPAMTGPGSKAFFDGISTVGDLRRACPQSAR